MTRARVVISGVVTALLLAAAAGAANPADTALARNLVAAQGDTPGMFETGGGLRPARCLPRTGFTITARATAPHWGTPHSFVDSVAAVLKTEAEAKAYYRDTVRAISACLAGQWRGGKQPPSVGPPRALRLPRYGDQSVARRMRLRFKPGTGSFGKFTFDWAVVRKHRAVLVDDFLFWVGWKAAGLANAAAAERRCVSHELARAFGS